MNFKYEIWSMDEEIYMNFKLSILVLLYIKAFRKLWNVKYEVSIWRLQNIYMYINIGNFVKSFIQLCINIDFN